MLLKMAIRMVRSTDGRLLWKFGKNFCYGGMRSVQKFKRRLKKGVFFPPFLYVSIVNSCNLRCQGCWVSVDAPKAFIPLDDMNRLINEAKQYGNRFFGLLGGEPLLHPQLMDILAAHPDCYFQLFSNGQMITEDVARQFRKYGNVTPLISIEGNEEISDDRRGRSGVLDKTMQGLQNCLDQRLITGVATSVCQNNLDLVTEERLDQMIDWGVHYAWYYTYRPVGPDPAPDLALTPEQLLELRRFIVRMRRKKPIGIVDTYYDDSGQAICPAAVGVSHHINPWGEIEPCPVIQFAKETIYDRESVFETISNSEFLRDFRETTAARTRGCIILEDPELLADIMRRHEAKDAAHRTNGRGGYDELAAMTARQSQHHPGEEIPEEHWAYRFAKKHWFFGFGAYA